MNIKTFYLCSYCRLPDNEISSLNDLKLSLHKLCQLISSEPTIFITGDFNLPSISWCDNYGSIYPIYGYTLNKLLVETVNDNNLEQLINETTHGNHILDLLFCSLSQMFKSHLESWTMMLSSFN